MQTVVTKERTFFFQVFQINRFVIPFRQFDLLFCRKTLLSDALQVKYDLFQDLSEGIHKLYTNKHTFVGVFKLLFIYLIPLNISHLLKLVL